MDLIGAISRFEKSSQVDSVAVGASAEAAARKLEEYLQSLREKDQRIGFSILEIMEELAKLALTPHAPNSTARISLQTLLSTKSRQDALALLENCQEQGLFNSGPADSPWFGSRFDSQEQIEEMTRLSSRLSESDFPDLQKRLDDLVISANFKSPKHLDDYAEYLALWSSVAVSLDRFVPEVFDRDVSELIDATGPRKLGSKISGSTRRKLKKLAKEFVRKGTSVSDLYGSLVDIKAQRDRWTEFSNESAKPTLLSGVSDTNVVFRTFISNLQLLRGHVDPDLGNSFNQMLLTEFSMMLHGLATKLEPLENFANRNRLAVELREQGLQEVHRNFADLHVKKESLAPQFEQVWWQSAFEIGIQANPSLLAFTGSKPETLFEDFVLADQNHIKNGALALNQAQGNRWQNLLTEEPSESEQLKQQLRARTTSIRALMNSSPRLVGELAGILGMSPYEVASKIPSNHQFDTVIILDAAGSTVGENVSALLRAEQILAFGDSAIAAPIGFELEARENSIELEPSGESAFNTVARIFGVETMRKSWRPAGQMLGELVNREFYQSRILYEATASDYLGKLNVDVQVVRSMPVSAADLMAESPDAEVAEAVNVILRHVIRHPEDSLLVVSASDVHSERVRGQLASKVLENAELKQFFEAHGDEKFEITTLNKLTHRVTDRVIFTPGFGVLSSGKAANELGQLSEPSGRRTLANLLVSARKALTVVTSIDAESLPEHPVGAAKQFTKMYSSATARSLAIDSNETDPLLSDLALRLRKMGTHVTLGYTSRISMAASYGAKAAVIVPDWNPIGEDLAEQVRLRPALLAAMGWEVIRVHALEVFADPQGVAIRIGDRLGMELSKKTEALFDDASFDETAQAWGDREESNDLRLKADKPPHWG
jgi:hypothetical protein